MSEVWLRSVAKWKKVLVLRKSDNKIQTTTTTTTFVAIGDPFSGAIARQNCDLSLFVVYVMVPVSAETARCPLVNAYHFTYSNNSGGQCRTPASYVRPCAATRRLRFHFRHCTDAAYTHDHGLIQRLHREPDTSDTRQFGTTKLVPKFKPNHRWSCVSSELSWVHGRI